MGGCAGPIYWQPIAWQVIGGVQAGFPPQVHIPVAEHPSAWAPQVAQALPFTPHWLGVLPGSQAFVAQQPVHDVPSQMQV